MQDSSHIKGPRLVSWSCPPPSFLKLIVDGSLLSDEEGVAGMDGLIRDESGCWLVGFTGGLGQQSILFAHELMAIKMGLQLVWDRGIRILFAIQIHVLQLHCSCKKLKFIIAMLKWSWRYKRSCTGIGMWQLNTLSERGIFVYTGSLRWVLEQVLGSQYGKFVMLLRTISW